MTRIEVRAGVYGCQRCPLHAQCNHPVPFAGPAPARVAVIGEAPGQEEDAQGKPFVGPSGTLARQVLARHRIDPDTVAFLNVVSCWPHRTPTPAEVNSCRENVDTQLALIQPEYCLLFGGVAVSRWWSIRIGEIRGLWWRIGGVEGGAWTGSWAMATWHPAAILRNRNLLPQMEEDIDFFQLTVNEGLPPSISQWCVKCGKAPATAYDKEIGYCLRHSPFAPPKTTLPPRRQPPRVRRAATPSPNTLFTE